ncbi:hypothetical protein ACRQ5Q_09880 [Bradyrhizobium sp. PMVTL-01]|uniref:hypothetical protein n=1 Tax=Bradyrhizobium sp. PMVTL-01 TaxID=3434999 RepID=UPI003F722A01
MAASGEPEGSAAAGNADSDTTDTNDSVSADAGNTNWPKRARRRQSCTCCGRQPWATGDVCYNRARLEAFRGDLRLHIIRPALATGASIHFDMRDNGRLMSSEWSSIVSTLAEDNSS